MFPTNFSPSSRHPRDRFAVFAFGLVLLLCATFAQSQNVRWDLGAPGSAGATTTSGSGLPFLVAIPGVTLNWCNYPAITSGPNTPCTNFANTFPSISSASPCPTNAQIVLQNSSTCVPTGDNVGNLGVWTAPGTYSYTLTVNGNTSVPFVETLTLGGGGGGGTSVTVNGTPASSPANFNNTTPAAPANALNVQWGLSTAQISAFVQGDGNAAHCLLGTGVFSACPGAGSSGTSCIQISNGSGGFVCATTGTYNSGADAFSVNTLIANFLQINSPFANQSTFPSGSVACHNGFVVGQTCWGIVPTTGRLCSADNGSSTFLCFAEEASPGLTANMPCLGTDASAHVNGGCTPLPSTTTAQVGDILRNNVNGDSAWDPVNWTQPFIGLYAINQSNALAQLGILGSSAVITGSVAGVNPTATLQSADVISATASASTNTVIALSYGQNGSVSLTGMEAFYRWSFRFSIGGSTNVRYWMGLGCWNNAGTGNNSVLIGGTTAYVADSPNKSTVGFRFSAGTDTHWQAVANTATGGGGTQTVVDTGITPDTSVHLFEMAPNAAGTSMNYLIDGVVVATISTNLPPPANGGNSWGDLFFTGDNKNTNTAISLTFYSMQLSLKL